jgi:hypothetical protein
MGEERYIRIHTTHMCTDMCTHATYRCTCHGVGLDTPYHLEGYCIVMIQASRHLTGTQNIFVGFYSVGLSAQKVGNALGLTAWKVMLKFDSAGLRGTNEAMRV